MPLNKHSLQEQELLLKKPKKDFYIPRRLIVVALCCLGVLQDNIDRNCLAVTIIDLSAEFKWSLITQGIVHSAFFYGYVLSQLPGGILASRFGAKVVFGLGALFRSFGTFLTTFVAWNLPLMIMFRVIIGLSQGVTYPALSQLAARWYPVSERSRIVSLMMSAAFIAIFLSYSVIPILMESLGWRSVYLILGCTGLAWQLPFYLYVYSTPDQHPSINEDELEYIHANVPTFNKPKFMLLPFFKNLPCYAVIIAHSSYSYGFATITNWFATYVKSYGIPLEDVIYASLPYVAAAILVNVAGWLSDFLYNKTGLPLTSVRKIIQTIAFLVPVFCFWFVQDVKDVYTAIILVSVGFGFNSFSSAASWVNVIDLGPRYASQMMAVTNSIGNIPSILANTIAGFIAEETGSYNLVFVIIVVLYLFATGFYILFAKAEVIFE